MLLYFLLALFWASAILYILGLAIGIFTYEHQETTIVYEEKEVELVEQPQQQKHKQFEQQEYQYDETQRVNMESMF